MRGTPLVSVVTPCLNPGWRLERCLTSVANQTYSPIEHIVVDGGSTDGTLELLARSPTHWISEADRGQVEAINKGLRLASGEIVSWLNADDVLKPLAVERAVASMQDGARWTYGSCRILRDGATVTLWRPPRRLTLRSMEAGEVVPQPGSFIARDSLERLGLLDERFQLAMDVELWIRLLLDHTPASRITDVVADFELHPGSKTGSLGLAPFYDEAAEAFAQHGLSLGAAMALGRARAHAALGVRGVETAVFRAGVEDAVGEALRRGWPEDAVRSAAATEAAVLTLRHRGNALRYLVDPAVWRFPQSRARLRAAARRATATALRARLHRPEPTGTSAG